jgi:hypothetical protein
VNEDAQLPGLARLLLTRGKTRLEETAINVARMFEGISPEDLAKAQRNGKQETPERARFRFLSDSDVIAQEPPGTLIDGILPLGALAALVGPFGGSLVLGPNSGIGLSLPNAGLSVLRSLAKSDMGDGLLSSEWESAFGGNRSTYMIYRKRLCDGSYVTRSKPGRGARYSVTTRGELALKGVSP